MPDRTITLNSNGSAVVSLPGFTTYLYITNPFSVAITVNICNSAQTIQANAFREYSSADLSSFRGYFEINAGSGNANQTLTIYYTSTDNRPNALSRLFGAR